MSDYWGERVDAVLAAYGDPEAGHAAEDKLLEDFVFAVAARRISAKEAQRAARRIADSVLHMERVRWYA